MANPIPLTVVTSPDVGLRLRSAQVREDISSPFEIQVVAESESATLDPKVLLGTLAAISVQVDDGATTRWFNGVVTSFGQEGMHSAGYSYRLVLRPWLWLATLSSDVKIFQNKSTPEIIKAVLGEYTGNIVDELTGTYQPREYCVQYRESDFHFVSRLMEEDGIFYFFRHSQSQHQLVLADAPGCHVPTPDFDTIEYFEDVDQSALRGGLSAWTMQHTIRSGKVTLQDYNFETPSTSLLASASDEVQQHSENKREVYDYPGRYKTPSAGTSLANIRIVEHEAGHQRFKAEGNSPGLAAGAKFTLERHPRDDQNKAYVVLATRIEFELPKYKTGTDQATKVRCSIEAIPASQAFRPPRSTHKPAVAGPQTAVVVGEPGDEICTDQHGRVKVQFHWDRVGQKNGSSSCWVRVASPWAGNGWGMISLPRVGQEVVVDFLEGDPDRPLITGRVHNAEQKTPYVLPANATVSTIKSRSSKGGGANDFNELRFDDKKGSEYVLLHAQKDRHEFVEHDLYVQVDNDEHRTVKKDRKERVEGEQELTVEKSVKQKVKKNLNLDVDKDIRIRSGAIYSLKTAQDIAAQSGATISLKSTGDLHMKIGANIGADAAQNVHIKGGMNVVLEAGVQISIKAGPSSIVLGPDGVSITGPMVKVNSGGSPGSGSGASPVAPTAPEPIEEAPTLPKDPLDHR